MTANGSTPGGQDALWRMLVQTEVLGVPKPKGSLKSWVHPRTKRVIVTHDNPNTKPWQVLVQAMVREVRPTGGPTREPVKVHLDFVLPKPKSLPKHVRFHVKKPDIDKLQRCLLDAMKGVVFHDDSQVVESHQTKQYGPVPGVWIRLYVADGTRDE
jgi:Holliday junction resolvase RusA-like endonuclease